MNWKKEIESYIPDCPQEDSDKILMCELINNYSNILTRDNGIAHITSSGYIVNKDRTKVLMIYHKIYNSWAWTGGHADGECDLLAVAVKEAKEETGLKDVKAISNNILSLDILNVNGHIKRGTYISSHLHLNVTYLLEGTDTDTLIVNEEETSGVKWIPIDEIDKYSTEEYMIKVYKKLNDKINKL